MMQYSEYVQHTTFFCQKGHCNLFNRKKINNNLFYAFAPALHTTDKKKM